MSKRKIFNDPVYGFIKYPFDILYDLINHPYVQRLRHISQMGLSHYVYPGALHTRFHHALGALYLMTRAIETLRFKNIDVTDEEYKAVCIAILLHDIGHGPFSHALEHLIIDTHHESLSLRFMELLNEDFDGQLQLAIQIFKDEHPKRFLHQLVSSQLDMDRMDYLNRDSYYTGVAEGVIGYDRLIEMLNVKDGQLMIEEKGIYSVEKFLVSRRIMYWQVYLHKTSIAVEQMLIHFMKRVKEVKPKISSMPLNYFIHNPIDNNHLDRHIIEEYAALDDADIKFTMKELVRHDDFILSFLSKSILQRKLYQVIIGKQPVNSDFIDKTRLKLIEQYDISSTTADNLIYKGVEENQAYSNMKAKEIIILRKNGTSAGFSEFSEFNIEIKNTIKHYACFPKIYS